MKTTKIAAIISATLAAGTFSAMAETEAKTTLDMNLRYENVDQNNTLKDASALTLRTRLNYTSASYKGFTGVVEFEDSRVIAGVDDYNNTNGEGGAYSVIADPESTELDQAYVQYKHDKFTAKIGRQVITLDGHRFVGHVGWRQDRQTFDAATFKYVDGKLAAQYSYISKRNRIFAEAKDVDAKDHLLNVSYKTSIGKAVGYYYSLEADAAGSESMDTYGVSLTGSKDKFTYAAELATQSFGDADADYIKLEGGYNFGKVTAKLGYEVLGSDDGAYGFSTPLATLHKFNGWADQFLGTPASGLEDVYVSLSGKAAGGKWVVAYHDFSADEGSADLGDELDLLYAKKFGKNYSAGIKYAMYSAGDIKVDTDKLWVWVGAKF
jgi:hypothetical protein